MADAYAYEAAAEQAALHKAIFQPMRVWYNNRPDLLAQHGPYPSFARDFPKWAPYKEVYREYSRYADQKERDERAAKSAPAPAPPPAPSANFDESSAVVVVPNEAASAPAPPSTSASSFADSDARPSAPLPTAEEPRKRKRWSDMPIPGQLALDNEPHATAVTKRRSRFAPAADIDDTLPPLRTRFGQKLLGPHVTLVPPGTPPVQEALFVYRVRIEEVNARLLLVPQECARMEADPNRPPSPPAEYDSNGKRTNTREQRLRRSLLDKRDAVVEKMVDLNPSLAGGTGPRFNRKLYVPYKEYPNYNFIGLIIGPRGNTQKRLEKETNCKIAVRGRGSGKEDKKNAEPRVKHPDDDDELHVAIQGERLSEVDAAEELIKDLLRPIEDDNNDWKRKQLLELALINGTLRDLTLPCHICGEVGHRQWDCPNKDSALGGKRLNIVCAICGDGSHVTADCKQRRRAPGEAADDDDAVPVDAEQEAEYKSFLQEVDSSKSAKAGAGTGSGEGGADGTGTGDSSLPPNVKVMPPWQPTLPAGAAAGAAAMYGAGYGGYPMGMGMNPMGMGMMNPMMMGGMGMYANPAAGMWSHYYGAQGVAMPVPAATATPAFAPSLPGGTVPPAPPPLPAGSAPPPLPPSDAPPLPPGSGDAPPPLPGIAPPPVGPGAASSAPPLPAAPPVPGAAPFAYPGYYTGMPGFGAYQPPPMPGGVIY
jgi:splicing factor 1